MYKILEKSLNFVNAEKWEPCCLFFWKWLKKAIFQTLQYFERILSFFAFYLSELQGFHCPQDGCSMMYTDRDRLIRHLLLRHKVILSHTWYHCLYCRYRCPTETRLKEHIKWCKNKPNENCTNTDDYGLLTRAQNKYKSVDDKLYAHKCHVCGKGFKFNCHLVRHTRTHTGERPYRCDTCGKGFTQKGDLGKHIRTHTQEKRFKCAQCDKAFSSKQNLGFHMKIHTGEKPYKCNECGKAFSLNCSLNVHIRIHTGDKPYKCDVCGLSFTQHSTLNTHKWIHTDERPHHCHICGKGFIEANKLRKHAKNCYS